MARPFFFLWFLMDTLALSSKKAKKWRTGNTCPPFLIDRDTESNYLEAARST